MKSGVICVQPTAEHVLIQALLDAPLFGVRLALERDQRARVAALCGRGRRGRARNCSA